MFLIWDVNCFGKIVLHFKLEKALLTLSSIIGQEIQNNDERDVQFETYDPEYFYPNYNDKRWINFLEQINLLIAKLQFVFNLYLCNQGPTKGALCIQRDGLSAHRTWKAAISALMPAVLEQCVGVTCGVKTVGKHAGYPKSFLFLHRGSDFSDLGAEAS